MPDEADRNARLGAYARQARASVCRIAEDGRTEVGLEVEHDGRWFRTIDHLPDEDDLLDPRRISREASTAGPRVMITGDQAGRIADSSRMSPAGNIALLCCVRPRRKAG